MKTLSAGGLLLILVSVLPGCTGPQHDPTPAVATLNQKQLAGTTSVAGPKVAITFSARVKTNLQKRNETVIVFGELTGYSPKGADLMPAQGDVHLADFQIEITPGQIANFESIAVPQEELNKVDSQLPASIDQRILRPEVIGKQSARLRSV